MSDYIGIKVAGGRIKHVLNALEKAAKRVHCYAIKNNQETLKIDFFYIKSDKKPEQIGNLIIKDLKDLKKGEIAAVLILRLESKKLHVFVNYKPDNVEQHFSVNFNTDATKKVSDTTNKYLQYGTYITPDILTVKESEARTLEEQIENDIEEDIFIEEELEKGPEEDRKVVVEHKKKTKKKGFSFIKLILFFFYGIFAAALILLLAALSFKEVSIKELLKLIGINLNINF